MAGFVFVEDGCWFAEVDLCAGGLGAQIIAVEHFADSDGVVYGVEGADDAPKGGEWGEGV